MRKLGFALLLSSLVAVKSFAFDMSAGIKGGASWQMAMGNTADDARDLIDASGADAYFGQSVKGNVGAFLEFGFGKFFALQTEFSAGLHNSLQAGGHVNYGGVSYDYRADTYYHSFDIALLLKGRIPLGENMRFTIMAGPSFNTAITDIYSEEYDNGKLVDNEVYSFEDARISPFTMSLIVEVGVEIDLAGGKAGYIPISLRGEWNFWNLRNTNNDQFNKDNSLYLHSPIGLFVGYGYRFVDSDKKASAQA